MMFNSIQILMDDAKWWLQETRKEAPLPDVFTQLDIKILVVKVDPLRKIEIKEIKNIIEPSKGKFLQDYQLENEARKIADFVQDHAFGIRIEMKVSTYQKKTLMRYIVALAVGEKIPKEIKKVVEAWQLGLKLSLDKL